MKIMKANYFYENLRKILIVWKVLNLRPAFFTIEGD